MNSKRATKSTVKSVRAYQVLDSGNRPTVACRVKLEDGKRVEFKVPSGASIGEKEALELRDRNPERWRKQGVSKAADNVNNVLAPLVEGLDISRMTQWEIDRELKDADGTKNKSKLGANAILAVSGAIALARAESRGIELWESFMDSEGKCLMPVPQFNILNAGRHACTDFEIQETMIVPAGAGSFAEAMEMGTDVWHALKNMLRVRGQPTGRGDEGGFVNPYLDARETMDEVLNAVMECGYAPGKDIWIAFDAAFSEIHGREMWGKESAGIDNTYHFGGKKCSSEEIAEFWVGLVRDYPIISIEDGMGENDMEGWKLLSEELGNEVQLVLDDYVCTNLELIRGAIKNGIGNSSLIKINQIGTISETLAAMALTHVNGRANVISHRSGETEDDFIAHLAMHPYVGQIKSGSSGSERNAKYNRLMIIEQELGSRAAYRGLDAFPKTVVAAIKEKN